ncbi:hypothetical protein EDB86DRAFT_2996588, partial [Lactarius hatsudake]
NVQVLWSTGRCLAFPFPFASSGSTSSTLPKRLLLIGWAGSARLLRRTLLRKAMVCVLPFNGRKLLRIINSLMLSMIGFSLILAFNTSQDCIEFQICNRKIIAHDRNKVLPFLGQSRHGNESLQLRLNGKCDVTCGGGSTSSNSNRTKTREGSSHLLELGGRVLIRIEVNRKHFLEVFDSL